jgi:type VI secretion system secreted protein Hcp
MRRLRLLVTGAVVSVFAALGVAAPAEAATTEYFLEINGISGESQDAKMAKTVDVLSYSWGVSRATGGQPNLGDFNLAKRVDSASPLLLRRMLQNQAIPSMELLARTAGQTQIIKLKYCFQNVLVKSIQHKGSNGDDATLEEVSFAYTSVTESYTKQNTDGTLAPSVFAGWNSTSGTLIQSYPGSCGF